MSDNAPDASLGGWTFDQSVQPKPLTPGTVIDGWTVGLPLGSGGAGTVYRVQGPSKQAAALKLLRPLATIDEIERFRREGELTAALRHPGIVRVHATGVIEGRPYQIYELLEGGELEQQLDSLPREQLLRILHDAAVAVGHAHAQGVVHRDLKPQNLLLDTEGRVRVADFGVAYQASGDRLTHSGALVGTPQAMPPEQITSERALWGPPMDVWALGVILYRVLSGQVLFAEHPNLAALSLAIVAGEIAPPRSLDSSVSPALDRVCMRALARDPSERFPDASAFAEALKFAQEGSPAPRSLGLVLALAVALALASVGALIALASKRPPATPSPALTPEPTPAGPDLALERARAALPRLRAGDVAAFVNVARTLTAPASRAALRAEVVAAALEDPARSLLLVEALPQFSQPQGTAAEEELAGKLLELLETLAEGDPSGSEGWLRAMAGAGLRPKRPQLESKVLASMALTAQLASNEVAEQRYWQQLLYATRLDFNLLYRPHYSREGPVLRASSRPWAPDTKDPWKRFVHLWVEYHHGQTEGTRQLLEELVLSNDPWLKLGPCTLARVASHLAPASGSGKRYRQIMDAGFRASPDDPILLLTEARSLTLTQDRERALETLKRAQAQILTQIDPVHVSWPRRLVLYLQIELEAELDRRSEAKTAYRMLRELDPSGAAKLRSEYPWLDPR